MNAYFKKYVAEAPELKPYFIWGFRFKMICGVAFAMLTHYYFKMGDSMMYFDEGVNLNKYYTNDLTNIRFLFLPSQDYWDFKVNMGNRDYEGYLLNEGNFMPMRLVSLLSFFTFRNFTVITLIFSCFSFIGLWKLFEVFIRFYPALKTKMAIAFLFLPSVIFWSSSILKDTICIGCIGLITKAFFDVIYFKKEKWNYFKIIFFSALLFITKYYIAITLWYAFFVYAILFFASKVKDTITKAAISLTLVLTVVVVVYNGNTIIEKLAGNFALDKVTESIENSQNQYKIISNRDGGSFFDLGELDPTPFGLLKMAPKVINAVFFRPYLWETSNLVMVLSALESLAMLLLLVYSLFKAGPINFFKTLFNTKLLIFCLVFCILFAFFVGISTPYFGSLVRYKIPCMPFFCAMLMIINTHQNLNKGIN